MPKPSLLSCERSVWRRSRSDSDVSTGQVLAAERPAFGRSYQTPYADRIRNEVGREHDVAVIAVGPRPRLDL